MDRISKLPDEVLCHILSFLSTKHAVATSILSSRWVYLWLSVPVIDLDDSIYLNPERKDPKSLLFVKFFDRVSSLNESETILKFRLRLHCNLDDSTHTLSDINGLIHNVFLRNIIEMDIKIYSYFFSDDEDELNYLKIPHSESLKVLRVRTRNFLKLPEFPGCFPSLRVFDAKCSVDYHDELITNMFPCSPALEKLCLVGDLTICTGEFNFNIGGPALKHLELELDICDYNECDALVVIDAPKLDYLWLKDGFMASYLVKHKPAITEVRLDLGEDSRFPGILYEVGPTRLTRFNKLLQGLVNTKFISVSASTLMVLFSQDWNIPVLPYLTKLELDVPACSWRLLLQWLQSCPDLKVLSLIIKEESPVEFEEGSEEESEEVGPDVVSSCLSSCVKEIEIKRLGKEINRLGKVDEEEMLKYLLDNAKVLEKCTVDSRVYIRDAIVQDNEWRNNLLVYFGLDKCTVDSRAKTPNVTMQPLPT